MRKISKKQIGAMGLAVMMTAQSTAMAAEIETSQTETTVVTQEVSQEDFQEEATVAEDVSAAEQEIVTEQETVSEQDSVMVQETVLEEDAIEETSIEVVTEETDNEESTSSEAQETKESVEIVTEAESREVENATIEDVETTEENEEVTTEEVLEENDLVAAQSALTEGWHTDSEGNRTYVENGKLIKDNAYYGFDWDGKLYIDTELYIDNIVLIWDGDKFVKTGISGFYRAKSDGTLYQNEWYEDSDGNTYYYGEECTAYEGIQQVLGKFYYFSEGRVSKKNMLFSIDSNTYRAKSDGSLCMNEWYKDADGTYYYYDENGHNIKNKVQKIGDSYYGFDSNGKMYADTAFYNADKKYYAKADGSLCENEWCYTYGWMYCGADRACYTDGIYEINNTLYYFNKYGIMATSGVYTQNGENYLAQEDGSLIKMPENGWFLSEGKYYYIENGEVIKKKTLKIDGAYYAFKENGIMFDATDNSIGSKGGEGGFYLSDGYYHAREDGSLYTSVWSKDGFGNWMYYCEDGHRATNESVTINGNTYSFNYNGEMLEGRLVGNDLFNESGVQVKKAGWNQIGGKWYYLNQDGTVYTGILTENGYTYYLNPEMVTGEDFIKIDDIYYKIDSDGHLSKLSDGFYGVNTAIYNYMWNVYYYLVDGKLVDDGWKFIDNAWYYFVYGAAYHNTSYRIDEKLYYFDLNGKLKTNGWFTDGSGVWCYAFSSGELATGDCTINGVLYHFGEDGRLKSGTIQQDNAIIRYGDDGSIAETIKFQEGWNLVDGVYYYLKDGKLLENTTSKLPDGKLYSFDELGRMRNNIKYYGRYYDESGAAMTGWIYDTGKWYYADPEDATLYSGFQTINGKKYYFFDHYDPSYNEYAMWIGETVIDGNVVTTDDGGVVVSIVPIENGWSFHGGIWYYYQDGKPYTGWVGTYLVESGKMVETNTWSGSRYIKADGREASGWFQINGDWYYFATAMTSNKQEYYWASNGKTYVFNENGVYIPADNYAQGWNLIDGYYYYKEGESFLRGTIKQINGDWYAFNTRGRMITGFTHTERDTYNYELNVYYEDCGRYYYGSDGRRCYYTGWQMLDGNWYYFNNYSEAVSGWKMINGVQYCFDADDHYMYTGYHAINGELYYFNADGSCWGKCGPQSGWYQAEGKWYFMKGGYVTTGSAYINGITYQFDDDGVMQE